MKSLEFVIVSPRQHHGGPIVLHALCKTVSEMGYKSRIFYMDEHLYCYQKNNEKNWLYRIWPDAYHVMKELKYWINYIRFLEIDFVKCFLTKCFPEYVMRKQSFNGYSNISVKGCRRKIIPLVGNRAVVVYPDIIYGNPLHASNVVRWLLYHNRYPNEGNAYGRDDLFYCYREIFNDAQLNPEKRRLQISYFDLNLYKRSNFGKRSGKCYIVRKGRNREDLPKELDGIVIDDLPEKEKVRVFNECEYCISYDTQTAYSSIASMCGCISIVVPEPGKTRADYKGEGEKGWGVAWGFDQSEIDFALETRDKIRKRYEKSNAVGRDSVKAFVTECEKYFGDSEGVKNELKNRRGGSRYRADPLKEPRKM